MTTPKSKAKQNMRLVLAAIAFGPVYAADLAAEPAPLPSRTITDINPTDNTRESFSRTSNQVRDISIPNAAWLQIRFGKYVLGSSSKLRIVNVENGESQSFSQGQLDEWNGLSALFDTNHLRVEIEVSSTETGDVFFEIEEIIVGERPSTERPDVPLGGEEQHGADESLCGGDDRQASTDVRAGRIVPIGCTGWIIGSNAFLTAGHCVSPGMQLLQFSVPASDNDGTINNPSVRDQYSINQSSIVFDNDGSGIGNDWAVFRVSRNTETGLLPMEAQGGRFTLSNSLEPNTVDVTGYGIDETPPGSNGGRNADNQTQQTHGGDFIGVTVEGDNDAFIEYTVDTTGGNSGSPVVSSDGSGEAIGIHTNAGCNPPSQGNTGTSFQHQRLWSTAQHFILDVGFQPPQPVIDNLAYDAGGWRVEKHPRMLGDVNGDGRDDIVAFGDQHVFLALGLVNGAS